MEKIRFGIIGIGMMGKMHMTNLQRNPYAEVVAGLMPDPSKIKAVQEEFNVPNGYTSINEMLEDCELDAVVVATGAALHKEACLAACKAGQAHLLRKAPG